MKTKSTQQLLDSTKRKQYIDKDVLKTAPEAEEGTVEFFKLGKYLSDDELEAEYISRDLIPAPIANIAQYDLEHPEKMDEMKYVGSHWKNGTHWNFVTFRRWYDGERRVFVRRYHGVWRDDWWFAGLRKIDLGTSDLSPKHSDTLDLALADAIEVVKEAGYKIYKEM